VQRIRHAPSPSTFQLREDEDLQHQIVALLRKKERRAQEKARRERLASTGSEGGTNNAEQPPPPQPGRRKAQVVDGSVVSSSGDERKKATLNRIKAKVNHASDFSPTMYSSLCYFLQVNLIFEIEDAFPFLARYFFNKRKVCKKMKCSILCDYKKKQELRAKNRAVIDKIKVCLQTKNATIKFMKKHAILAKRTAISCVVANLYWRVNTYFL